MPLVERRLLNLDILGPTCQIICNGDVICNGTVIKHGNCSIVCNGDVVCNGIVVKSGKSGTIAFDPYSLGIAYGGPLVCLNKNGEACNKNEKVFEIAEIELIFNNNKFTEVRTKKECEVKLESLKRRKKKHKKIIIDNLKQTSKKVLSEIRMSDISKFTMPIINKINISEFKINEKENNLNLTLDEMNRYEVVLTLEPMSQNEK